MFEALKGFDFILVTGPQRSGTRIAARCIAADTGHGYIDEVAFQTHDQLLFDDLISERFRVVIHCPAMCHRIHAYGTRDNVLVIMMIRELYEIEASQRRISWAGEQGELAKYRRYTGPIAMVKYAYWLAHQRHRIKHWKEIDYLDLSKHRLWIPADQRVDFEVDQWHA